MPKECAHWIIARRIASSYTGPRVRALLDRHEPFYLLGAVLPDTAFYTLAGRDRPALREVSATLHGIGGGDPLAFLERVAAQAEAREPLQALALGAACHIMTDSQYHPIVYYFCGIDGVHPGALERHFTFEGWLDVHYSSLQSPPFNGRLARIVAAAGSGAAGAAHDLLFDGVLSEAAVARALRRHAAIQRRFFSRPLRGALRALRRLAPWPAGEVAALMVPAAARAVPFFGGSLSYRVPATGESRTETLAEVEARVAALAHRVFSAFEAEPGPARLAAARALPRLSAETGVEPGPLPRRQSMRVFGVTDVNALLGVKAGSG